MQDRIKKEAGLSKMSSVVLEQMVIRGRCLDSESPSYRYDWYLLSFPTTNFKFSTVKEKIKSCSDKREAKLYQHINVSALQLLDN